MGGTSSKKDKKRKEGKRGFVYLSKQRWSRNGVVVTGRAAIDMETRYDWN